MVLTVFKVLSGQFTKINDSAGDLTTVPMANITTAHGFSAY